MELLRAEVAERRQRHIAGGLLAAGLVAGDRCVMATTSPSAMLLGVLAALRVGIVPVVLNSGLLDLERRALLADADPQLVADDEILSSWERSAPTELAPVPLGRPMHYTSGTTGEPKGVWSGLLSEREGRALADEESELWGFDGGDRLLMCSPLHHSVAIRFCGGVLLAGGDVIVSHHFDAPNALQAIHEHAPTLSFMVPAHLQRVHSHTRSLEELRSLRLLVHAGSPCPATLKREAIRALDADRVWEFYGSTEGQFSACSGREWLERPGTVGRARASRRLFVAGHDEAGESDGADAYGREAELAEIGSGTIWCEAPGWARFEYWRDRAKTDRSQRSGPDGGRCFTVGDLGRLDADGYLYLDGRRDDLIITGGVNVYPAEIEQVLAGAPGVGEVAVFGRDDERWGTRVCAAFVPEGESSPDVGAVRDYARTNLAGHKRPKELHVVRHLPHTSTGKLQRRLVADFVDS